MSMDENPWKEAVIDALVVNHILEANHETDPRKALADLIAWEVKVALDPKVSEAAAKLAGSALSPIQIVSFQINPVNGNIVALCQDGSMWIRPGVESVFEKPWKPLPKPAPKPKEEPEDAITTFV